MLRKSAQSCLQLASLAQCFGEAPTHPLLEIWLLIKNYQYSVGIFPLVYADPVPGLKRVWRIRYTSQPVRMTGRVGGGDMFDG